MVIHCVQADRTGRYGVLGAQEATIDVSALVSSYFDIDLRFLFLSTITWLQSMGHLSQLGRAGVHVQLVFSSLNEVPGARRCGAIYYHLANFAICH